MNLTDEKYQAISLEAAYQAAHQSAIVVDRSQLGMLKFTGESRLDLINRMSTQKVLDLQSGEGKATVLTSDIGRIIDRLILYAASDSVYCLTSEDNGQNIADYLRRFVFYMDDFQVEDLSEETAIFAVYGSQAQPLLTGLFGEAVALPLHHWTNINVEGSPIYIHRTDPVAGDGYFIMGQEQDKGMIWELLVNAGIEPVDEEAFEYLRIESAQPRFGHELTADYIPLEANLWPDVSFNKGCYTGQEIIARMESRGRLAKRMVSLRAEELLEVGEELQVDGKKAGSITSAAGGPVGFLGLGFIKTAFLDEGNGRKENIQLKSGEITVEIDARREP
jgi:folate-binding protein YgfZ